MKEVLENVNNYVVIIDENEIIKFCNEKFAKKIRNLLRFQCKI